MGLATTGGAEVEGESQVKKSRRAIGTGGRLAGLRLRLRLAGWLLYSIFIGHARGSNSGRLACEATCGTTWAYQLQHIDALPVYFLKHTNYQLPNGPVKAGRPWGQRHPQGANLGSNGILKFLSKTRTMAATSPP